MLLEVEAQLQLAKAHNTGGPAGGDDDGLQKLLLGAALFRVLSASSARGPSHPSLAASGLRAAPVGGRSRGEG